MIGATGSSKALMMTASMAVMAVFYKDAMIAGRQAIDKVRLVSVSYDLTLFDAKLLFRLDAYGAMPDNIPAYIASQVTTHTGRNILVDQWGTPYHFEALSDGYIVRSAGPDRIMGTDDDLYVARQGDAMESRLSWVRTHEELTQPLHDLEIKQADALKKILQQDAAALAANTPVAPPPPDSSQLKSQVN